MRRGGQDRTPQPPNRDLTLYRAHALRPLSQSVLGPLWFGKEPLPLQPHGGAVGCSYVRGALRSPCAELDRAVRTADAAFHAELVELGKAQVVGRFGCNNPLSRL